MSSEFTSERIYIFTDTLADGSYLFKTEHGSLATEDMLKGYLLQQFERAISRLTLDGNVRLRITMEVSEAVS